MTGDQLVSVVIPAYNAAATLDETLRSIRSQTHSALQIIIVDDGTTDDTAEIARRQAAVDNRVELVTQINAGVAVARNEGWRRARSDLIAFVDADDLWAPTKIERQIQAFQSGGPRVGLVYCWFARIDSEGLIAAPYEGHECKGDVLDRIFASNFVGNGSSALIGRQALVDAGGFDSRLLANGAQGCEDYLLYCRIAESHHFAVVPEYLVGYRHLPQNMSSDRPRMLRSWILVVDEMLARHPNREDVLNRGLRHYGGWLVRDALSSAAHRQLASLLRLLLRRHWVIAMQVLVNDLLRPLAGRLRGRLGGSRRLEMKPAPGQIGQRFAIGDVDR